MPQLVRLYIRDCLMGLAIGIAFSALLVALNVGNLGHLVSQVEGGWMAFALLALFNGLVFGGVHFGINIMMMSDREK